MSPTRRRTMSANVSKCWNWFSPAISSVIRESPRCSRASPAKSCATSVSSLGACISPGLSAGGAAAAIMGATYPDLYAAIGVHSGLACGAASDMPSAFAAMRQGRSDLARAPRQGPDAPFRPSYFTETAIPPSTPSTAIRSLPNRRLRRIFEQPSRPARHREGCVTPAPCKRTKTGDQFWSSGFCTEPATHGPAGALPDRTPSHAGPMPVAR